MRLYKNINAALDVGIVAMALIEALEELLKASREIDPSSSNSPSVLQAITDAETKAEEVIKKARGEV